MFPGPSPFTSRLIRRARRDITSVLPSGIGPARHHQLHSQSRKRTPVSRSPTSHKRAADSRSTAWGAIRPIAIGKKNWLFTGSERAGRRAAAIQSLFTTAKLNRLDPLRWLTSVLERLPTCPNSQFDTLLPFPNSTQS